MKADLFAELMQSASEALEHARGMRDLRTILLPDPPASMNPEEVKRLRGRLKASQAVFARCLNVSTKLVQAWEGDRRKPEGAALRLLRLAENFPALILENTADRSDKTYSPKNAVIRKRSHQVVTGRNGRRQTTSDSLAERAARENRRTFESRLKKVRARR